MTGLQVKHDVTKEYQASFYTINTLNINMNMLTHDKESTNA